MPRPIVLRLHAATGALALAMILGFQAATLLAETLGTPATIAAVKQAIAWSLLALVPALASAGLTGRSLGQGCRLPVVATKQKRMAFAALNGLLVLVPAAITLARLSARGDFGPLFTAVQIAELTAGAVNVLLLGLNMRDGLALRARRLAHPPSPGPASR